MQHEFAVPEVGGAHLVCEPGRKKIDTQLRQRADFARLSDDGPHTVVGG